MSWWSLAFQPQMLRYQWEREEREVQHSDHTPKTYVFVDNHIVCVKVITHMEKHLVGNSGRKLVYQQLNLGFLQTVSNQNCKTTYGHLCKSTPGLNEDIRGENNFWHLHLTRVCSGGRMKIHNNSPIANKTRSGAVEPDNGSIPGRFIFLPSLSLLEVGSSAKSELSYWHLPPQKLAPPSWHKK